MGRKKLERPPVEHLYQLLMRMLVPSHIQEHFEMWDAHEYKDRWVIEMREKAGALLAALSSYEDIMFDGYCNPSEVLSHSFVCKPIYLRLYRRRYKRSCSDRHYSNAYDVTLKMVPELEIFLKEES